MEGILIATAVVAAVGVILGTALVFAGKLFHVDTDERVILVRECLRGSNCGACGYAGCDAVAEAIVKGEARVDACPGNSTENIAKIAAILGKEAIDQDPQVAFVSCAGTCSVTSDKANYIGIPDCRAAVLSGVTASSCDFGCLGMGSCVRACPQNAISIRDGVAVVNRKLCIGCGLCAKTCPRGVIRMMDRNSKVTVQCSNKDKGPAVKKVCTAGCLGCGLCAKQCPEGAIEMVGSLPKFIPEKCIGCGKCVEKCPVKAIHTL